MLDMGFEPQIREIVQKRAGRFSSGTACVLPFVFFFVFFFVVVVWFFSWGGFCVIGLVDCFLVCLFVCLFDLLLVC